MTDLFDAVYSDDSNKPLADRMRPDDLGDFFGQEGILGPNKILRKAIEGGRIFSMLFWGPPGTGKTTLARIIAKKCRCNFVPMSAVAVGVKEIKQLAKKAGEDLKYGHSRTILFLDEVHRFNRSQQDSLLPYVEDGTLILIGATTENPSFEVNAALLSRLRVFALEALSTDAIKAILTKALRDPSKGLGGRSVTWDDAVLGLIASLSGGDARCALNILEIAANAAAEATTIIYEDIILDAAQKSYLLYDKQGEQHYNLISALHKSLRDSDPDGGLYWLGRMLQAGEDSLYIARRLIRFASEDVGLASPAALEQTVAAYQACHFLGMPECALALAQAVVFLATAPKSNALESAYISVKEEIAQTGHLSVPLHLRNAPTKLMKDFGYGRGYQYANDFQDAVVDQEHLPEGLRKKRFYFPTRRGFEQTICERIEERKKEIEALSPKQNPKKKP